MMSRDAHFHIGACLVTLAFLAIPIITTAANTLERDRDPLVLTGQDVSGLIGANPDSIVAFRYEGAWVQIPVQVDERAAVDFGIVYGDSPSGFLFLTYTDTSTFTGHDPDAAFDADDELVLMAKHAGEKADGIAGLPEGVPATGSGVELTIIDPLGPDSAYAYLFEGDGTLDPGAGTSPVSYTFSLLSGDYKTTYNTEQGPNPEDSDVVTVAYRVHFADRWIRDETAVTAGSVSGVDILDRHKSLFAPGNCARSEDTFSNGEGAFIINREGAVRGP